jgi:arylsulfatase
MRRAGDQNSGMDPGLADVAGAVLPNLRLAVGSGRFPERSRIVSSQPSERRDGRGRARRPNFLVILTDQQRADHLGCMGNPVLRTPNIDRIARGGAVFENHHVNNPVCMPSRATLLTGRTPRAHLVRCNGIPLPASIPTLPAALAAAGYRTHNVGKIHLRTFGTPNGVPIEQLDPAQYTESAALWKAGVLDHVPAGYYGFQTTEITIGHGPGCCGDYDTWIAREHPDARKYFAEEGRFLRPPTGADQSFAWALPAELHHSTWVADRSIAFLREQASRDEPFFVTCSFPDPHHPFCPPAPWCDVYDPADVPMPVRRDGELDDLPPFFREVYEKGIQLSGRVAKTRMPDAHIREIIAHTFGMVHGIDVNVGRVLDALDALGMAENTVVIYTSDHGDMMGDHWMLNKGPFLFRGLTRVPMLVRWPAAVPAGARMGSVTSHLDFAPTILQWAGARIDEGLVPPRVETSRGGSALPGVSLVPLLEGGAAAVRDRALVEFNEDYLGTHTRTLVTADFRITIYSGRPYGELFDLRADPDELHNLWDAPAAASLKADAQAQLLDELAATDSNLPRRLCHA